MGWDYTQGATRQNIIERRIKAFSTPTDTAYNCLAYCCVGNVMWSVWSRTENHKDPVKFIGCDILAKSKFGWGYKSMVERGGPHYYTCPATYLAMTEGSPEVNPEWRASIATYREVIALSAGDEVVFEEPLTFTSGFKASHFRATGKRNHYVAVDHRNVNVRLRPDSIVFALSSRQARIIKKEQSV